MGGKRLVLIILNFIFLSLLASVIVVYAQGTGIACNPRQGVWALYQPAFGGSFVCGGERLVYWSEIEPVENQFYWESLKWYLDNTDGQIFLAIPVTASEGRKCDEGDLGPKLPEWVCKGGKDRGVYRKANNRTCQGGCIPNWLEPKMCQAIGEPDNCWDSPDVEPNGSPTSRQKIIIEETPIIWNSAFKTYFQRAVERTAQWLNNNPQYRKKVALIYASSGGAWGEMNLVSWSKRWKNEAWFRAGYTNEKFAKNVYDILDYYNSAFLDFPISVQTGSGMFCYGPGNPPGCDHSDSSGQGPANLLLKGFDGRPGLIDKYGLKINIRINGWGSITSNGIHPQGSGTNNYCSFSCSDPSSINCSLATCSFESGTGPKDWRNLKESCQKNNGSCSTSTSCTPACQNCLEKEYQKVIQGSINSAVSIQSVKNTEIANIVNIDQWRWPFDPKPEGVCSFNTQSALIEEARQLGAQILVRQPEISINNRRMSFKANFHNRGNRPPFSTKAIGSKWVAQSLKLGFGFYQNGVLKDRALVEPNRPSYFWKKETNENPVDVSFDVPSSLSIGQYQVKLFLFDPKNDYHWKFFDSSGNIPMEEADLGTIDLAANAVITSTPAVSNTPADCVSRSQGDANCDQNFNDEDYQIWQCEFIGNGGCPQYESDRWADFNRDGKVDLVDFEIWRKNGVNN